MASSAVQFLAKELRSLLNSPIEGFTVEASEDNLLKWKVGIFGPPGTIYEGGYFKANLNFPANYPYEPPTMRFTSPLFHPNIFESGSICISILHPPVDDPQNDQEDISERWNPTQSVRTVLLSVISLLNEPNTSSPANVEASRSYKAWKAGQSTDYERTVKQQVAQSKKQAEMDGIIVPTSLEDYCMKEGQQVEEGYTDADFYDNGDENYGDDYYSDEEDEE
ncbi:hypothetical protein QR680_013721 [Steinernema hermaphroditum]|uniref:UBC core domain-containing protein n=1 Tax=Steinernema hermaphroditum TaxID=289476 RepID=A0AA39M202_9BILA|nr:hypothetical protein QR680_013721 [Steinernema hermaphroditum]